MGKLIEVDEDLWNRNEAVRKTVAAMYSNPTAKKLVEQAHKMVDANAVTPELDAEKAQEEKLNGVRKEFEDLKSLLLKEKEEEKKRRDEEFANSKLETGRRYLREHNWTEDGIKKLEELMVEKNIPDHQIAAVWYEKQNPPPPPATPSGTTSWDFIDPTEAEGDAMLKKLIDHRGNNDMVTNKMAQQALAEFRAGMLPRR